MSEPQKKYTLNKYTRIIKRINEWKEGRERNEPNRSRSYW